MSDVLAIVPSGSRGIEVHAELMVRMPPVMNGVQVVADVIDRTSLGFWAKSELRGRSVFGILSSC
jgi:hypothetical protein